MTRPLLLAIFAWAACCQQPYELSGRFTLEARASVSLFAITSPFVASAMSEDGRFSFRNLQPGAYTIAIFVPGRGEGATTAPYNVRDAAARATRGSPRPPRAGQLRMPGYTVY